MKKVIITIPIYKKCPNTDETKSFKQCLKILSNHPICIITFKSLDISFYQNLAKKEHVTLQVSFFSEKYFKSISGYSRLMISSTFYKSFKSYEYLLIYQLDAWVFRDDLLEWCNKEYDYIGAPWFDGCDEVKSLKEAFNGVGNGGFSLRRTQTMLRVLNTFSYIHSYRECIAFLNKQDDWSYIKKYFSLIKTFTVSNNTHHWFNNYSWQEDMFWCRVVASRFSWFKRPTFEEAITFSIEKHARECYEYSEQQLPFGAHALWHKNDAAFWDKFI
jgi:hypothetical protein